MALKTEQLLTLKQLPSIGDAKVFSMANYAVDMNLSIDGIKDLLDFVNSCISKKIVKGIKKDYQNGFDIDDMKDASNIATSIIGRSEDAGINVVSYYDKLFPDSLKTIKTESGKSDSPLILYYKGSLKRLELQNKGIAIIGTREPTSEGIKAGEYFSELFAKESFNIISGLAIGCDSSAHRGALNGSGLTTAFLAHGLDIVYPKENKDLAQRIIDNGGLLISEYPIGTSPMANYFVARDRLQSGLADATLVIQTGIKGGTMHAVNATINNQKPLFVVQYKDEAVCKHEKVQGNMMLLAKGSAKPLTASNVDEAIKIISKAADIKEQHSSTLFG